MSEEKSPFTTSTRSEALPAVQDLQRNFATPTQVKEAPDADEQALARRVTWKCDIKLVPVLGSLYLTAFLDRTNLANAKLEGFEKDLHMPSNGYNTALWIFFLSFVLFEAPLNLFMNWQKVKPNQWLGGMMFLLGEQSPTKRVKKS